MVRLCKEPFLSDRDSSDRKPESPLLGMGGRQASRPAAPTRLVGFGPSVFGGRRARTAQRGIGQSTSPRGAPLGRTSLWKDLGASSCCGGATSPASCGNVVNRPGAANARVSRRLWGRSPFPAATGFPGTRGSHTPRDLRHDSRGVWSPYLTTLLDTIEAIPVGPAQFAPNGRTRDGRVDVDRSWLEPGGTETERPKWATSVPGRGTMLLVAPNPQFENSASFAYEQRMAGQHLFASAMPPLSTWSPESMRSLLGERARVEYGTDSSLAAKPYRHVASTTVSCGAGLSRLFWKAAPPKRVKTSDYEEHPKRHYPVVRLWMFGFDPNSGLNSSWHGSGAGVGNGMVLTATHVITSPQSGGAVSALGIASGASEVQLTGKAQKDSAVRQVGSHSFIPAAYKWVGGAELIKHKFDIAMVQLVRDYAPGTGNPFSFVRDSLPGLKWMSLGQHSQSQLRNTTPAMLGYPAVVGRPGSARCPSFLPPVVYPGESPSGYSPHTTNQSNASHQFVSPFGDWYRGSVNRSIRRKDIRLRMSAVQGNSGGPLSVRGGSSGRRAVIGVASALETGGSWRNWAVKFARVRYHHSSLVADIAGMGY